MAFGNSISFDGNDLQTATIVTGDIDHGDIPVKDAKMYARAHANSSVIPYVSYPSRTIRVSGTLIGGSFRGMDALLDTFKSYFIGQDKNLDIGYNGNVRRYIATLNKTTITRPNNLTWARFVLEFQCTQPFGQDTSQTTAINASGRTSASYSDSYTFLGTAPYQQPIITVTYTAVTSTGSQSVIVGNNNNGQQITVLRPWSSGDILQVDSTKKTVTINGIPVNFSGAFPLFGPGAQAIGYGDGLTTRTFNYNVVYTPRYL